MDLQDINMETSYSDQAFFFTFPTFSVTKSLSLYNVQLKLMSNI